MTTLDSKMIQLNTKKLLQTSWDGLECVMEIKGHPRLFHPTERFCYF